MRLDKSRFSGVSKRLSYVRVGPQHYAIDTHDPSHNSALRTGASSSVLPLTYASFLVEVAGEVRRSGCVRRRSPAARPSTYRCALTVRSPCGTVLHF